MTHAIIALFSVNGIGIERGMPYDANGVYWFVSAMLWTFILFYYLLQNYSRKNANLVIALLVYLSSVLTYNVRFYDRAIEHPLIAISCIGIGYFVSQWYKGNKFDINQKRVSIIEKLAFTIIEIACLYFILYNLFFGSVCDNRFCFVIVAAFSVILFLIKKGYISKLLDWNGLNFFSKYTYSIYMVHCVVYMYFRHYIIKYFVNYPILVFIFLSCIAIICGILTYHIIEKPFSVYLREKFLKNI